VDLADYLGLTASENPGKDIFIITNFNKMRIAFHVHAVESISRISWGDIEKPDSIIYGGQDGVVTGIAKVNDRIISILDFEKISYDISPETGIQIDEVDLYGGVDRSEIPILTAEDSTLLRKLVKEALNTAGYFNIVSMNNGEEAWNYLNQLKAEGDVDQLRKKVSCLITDIEMPKMDGHRLVKMVKSDPDLKDIPVIIFSSLIDENMHRKGEEVGADAQLSKPEIANLVGMIDTLINQKRG
jgi:two-component system chemotaxis response regulator CheV